MATTVSAAQPASLPSGLYPLGNGGVPVSKAQVVAPQQEPSVPPLPTENGRPPLNLAGPLGLVMFVLALAPISVRAQATNDPPPGGPPIAGQYQIEAQA